MKANSPVRMNPRDTKPRRLETRGSRKPATITPVARKPASRKPPSMQNSHEQETLSDIKPTMTITRRQEPPMDTKTGRGINHA